MANQISPGVYVTYHAFSVPIRPLIDTWTVKQFRDAGSWYAPYIPTVFINRIKDKKVKKAIKKIPEKLYIAVAREMDEEYPIPGDYNTVVEVERFVGDWVEYKPLTAAGKKKIDSANYVYQRYGRWNSGGVDVVELGNDEFTVSGDYEEWNRRNKAYETIQVTPQLAELIKPRVVLNEPITGWKVVGFDTVSSSSNKLWTLQDPRNGILFNISTDSMERIMKTTVIDKGVIVGKCVWVGKRNLVCVEDALGNPYSYEGLPLV